MRRIELISVEINLDFYESLAQHEMVQKMLSPEPGERPEAVDIIGNTLFEGFEVPDKQSLRQRSRTLSTSGGKTLRGSVS